jgi:hypothetical protein
MKITKKKYWVGGLEIAGMILILISFYYQSFYEGNNLKARYDNIRFKLELIQNEVIQNSKLIGGQNDSEYSLGNTWKGFNKNRHNLNNFSEKHLTDIDRFNALISSVKAWIFIAGSILLIISKGFDHFCIPRSNLDNN